MMEIVIEIFLVLAVCLLIVEAYARYAEVKRQGSRICKLCARLSVLEGREPPCEGYKKAVEAMKKDIHVWALGDRDG